MAGLAGARSRGRARLSPRLVLAMGLGVLLTIGILLPIAFMFFGAVRTGSLVDPNARFTFQKILDVYTTLPALRVLGITIAVSAIVALLSTVLGVALAWLIARTDLPAKGWLENGVIAPLYLSPFVGALAWLILAAPNAGVLNRLARDLFGVTSPVLNVMTPTGIILVMTLYFIPYAYLTVSASLRSIDPSMEEASYLNGAGVIKTAVKVTLPVIRPSLISAFFFIFVLTAGTFSIPAALGGTRQLPFLAVDIYQSTATYPVDYGKASAIGTLLFWLALIGIAFYRYASRLANRFVTVTARGYRIRLVRLRAWRTPAIVLVLSYLVLAILLPYLALFYSAFTSFTSSSILDAQYTLRNAIAVASSKAVTSSIGNTLLVGVIAPTLCAVLALVLAYAIRRLKVPGSKALDYLAMVPIAVPGIVFGTGFFWTYVTTPIYGTIWILVVAFVASYLPFAYRISDTALMQIDRALEEASALCGAGHWRTATRITLRLVQPAVLSGWVLVFIFSVREISSAILLSSPSNKVLSVMSWDYLEYGNVQNAAVVGLLQTAILTIGVLAGRYVFRVRLTQGI